MAELSNRAGLSTSARLRESLFYFPLIFGGAILIALLFVVLFGPVWAPHNPYLIDRIIVPHYDFETEEFIRVPLTPNAEFPLGTDERGMDIVSLLLYGARNTMVVGVMVAAARVTIGLLAGMLMGWNANRGIDRFFSGLIGVLTSVPALIAAMILVYSFGIRGGIVPYVTALTVMGWTEVAQFMRGEVLVLRKMPFMEGARVVGARDGETLLRHVFPNILPQLFVMSFLEIGAVLMLMGELALLGVFIGGGSTLDLSDIMAPPLIIGIPSQPDWAAMVASGFRWLRSNPHVVLAPAAAIFVAVLGFNAFGEGLRAFFEKRGAKATFLLGKRILWVFLVVSVVIAAVMSSTQPSRWYREMAEGFQGPRTIADTNALQSLWPQEPSAEGILPAAQLIADEFERNGLKGGVPWSTYVYTREAEYYEDNRPPTLEVLDGSGTVTQRFASADEIAYVVDTSGAEGDATGSLLVLGFPEEFNQQVDEDLEALEAAGRVVMLQESDSWNWMGTYFAFQDAAAVIWVAKEGDPLHSGALRVPARTEEMAIPTLRVSAAVAEQLLAENGLDLSVFTNNDSSLVVYQLDTQVRVTVDLQPPQTVLLNSVVAYRSGTDADFGDEVIMFFVACDGLWRSEQTLLFAPVSQECAAPTLMEISRLLDENLIDTRRPIMFVVWGGGEFGSNDFLSWLTDRRNYAISSLGLSLTPRVTMVIQLSGVADPQGEMLFYEGNQELNDLVKRAGGEFAQTVRPTAGTIGLPLWFSEQDVPFQTTLQIYVGDDAEIIERQGETIIFALIRLVRENILDTD